MTAEARIRTTASFLNYLVTWYSFCLIVLSVGQLSRRFDILHGDLLAVWLSIGVFGLSILIQAEKLGERADQFRSCYLKLQNLYNSTNPTDDKMAAYSKILSEYQNQHDDDYDAMLFDAWRRGQKLQNAYGDVSVSIFTGIKVVVRRLTYYGLGAILFGVPIIVAAKFGEFTKRVEPQSLVWQISSVV